MAAAAAAMHTSDVDCNVWICVMACSHTHSVTLDHCPASRQHPQTFHWGRFSSAWCMPSCMHVWRTKNSRCSMVGLT